MTTVNTALQNLLDRASAKSQARGALLRVQSGDGRIDFRGSAGSATPDLRFPIASISKTYTAALILQLVDEGRLTLDQTVQGALPEVDLSGVHVVIWDNPGAALPVIRAFLDNGATLANQP